ncbi:MAG: GGDEF domain-containing protein [Bacillota bacterium]
MQQLQHFRVKMVQELYLGVQIMSVIALIIFSRYFSDQFHSTYINYFLLVYVLYVSIKVILFVRAVYFMESQEQIEPSLWITLVDGVFLAFFLYIARDYFSILTSLFYIYILFLSILFHHRHPMIYSSFAAACYILLVILQNPKALFSLAVITHILLFYLLGYILSSVMNEIHRLEIYIEYMYKELKEKNFQLGEMASKDFLTGLYNHKTFYIYYREQLHQSTLHQTPFSLALLDIDNFKKVNDTYGHLAGDKILKGVSALIQDSIRKTDIAARYGGEEFAIIFPNTSPKDGEEICERIRKVIENHDFDIDTQTIRITISGGLAGGTFTAPNCKQNKFLEFVDQLLYKAKSHGKNQIQSNHQIVEIDCK